MTKFLSCMALASLLMWSCKKNDPAPAPVAVELTLYPKPIFESQSRDKYSIGDYNNPYLFQVDGSDESRFYMNITVKVGSKNYSGLTTVGDDGKSVFLGFRDVDMPFEAWNIIPDGAKVTFKVTATDLHTKVILDSVKYDLTKTSPTQLFTWKDVENAVLRSYDFQIQNDITFPNRGAWQTSVYQFKGFGLYSSFNNVLDGQGHRFINFPGKSNLCTHIGATGIVKNLSIEVGDAKVIDTGGFNGVMAYTNSGLISNCMVKGTINGNSSYSTGGLVGINLGTIQNCFVKGDVTNQSSTLGGIAGTNDATGVIKNSYYEGKLKGGSFAGGVVGSADGVISDCYAIGSVSGSSYIGGIVGAIVQGTFTNSYFAGTVTSTDNTKVGAIAGSKLNPSGITLTHLYYDNTTTAVNAIGGGVGDIAGQAEGQSSASMKVQATYVAWDFANIWTLNATTNNGYPSLR